MSIETKPCDNAEDLIQELDIILPRWSYNNWNSEWIFRGQAETEQPLPLVSAALRSEEHASEQMGIARLTSKKWNKWRNVEEVLGNSQINLSFDG